MLCLRSFAATDHNRLVQLADNPNVARHMSSRFPSPFTRDDASWWIKTGSKDGIIRAIDWDGQLVGCIGVTPGQYHHIRQGEIGYWIGEPWWGKGIATAAVVEHSRFVLATTQIVRLYGSVFAPNRASMRVLEKAGYSEECVHRQAVFNHGQLMDEHIYVLLSDICRA